MTESNPPKIITEILTASSPQEIESIAKKMASNQFLEILLAISDRALSIEKLPPILVGLTNETFCEALFVMPKSLIQELKKEAVGEPLQHHLTLFVHNCELTHQHYHQEIQNLREQIAQVNREELGYEKVYKWHEQIQELGSYYSNILESVNKALDIVWSGERIDLIEKLSAIKEHAVNQLKNEIGLPHQNELPMSSLLLFMRNSLESVYIEAELEDEDPATEGMTAFSVWYLKDYWKLGLLPEIEAEAALEGPSTFDENEKILYKQQLFQAVNTRLAKLNLNTVADLKSAGIYSKLMLKQYIEHFKKEM